MIVEFGESGVRDQSDSLTSWCQTIITDTLLLYDLQSSDEWQYEERNYVFKLAKMYRLSSTSCIYTDSDIPLGPARVQFSKFQEGLLYLSIPPHIKKKASLQSSRSKSASLIHWSCTHLEVKSNLLQKNKK